MWRLDVTDEQATPKADASLSLKKIHGVFLTRRLSGYRREDGAARRAVTDEVTPPDGRLVGKP